MRQINSTGNYVTFPVFFFHHSFTFFSNPPSKASTFFSWKKELKFLELKNFICLNFLKVFREQYIQEILHSTVKIHVIPPPKKIEKKVKKLPLEKFARN